MNKKLIFVIIGIIFLIIPFTIPAFAAQMDAQINPNANESNFKVVYEQTVFIEYPYRGQLFDILHTKEWILNGQADNSDKIVQDIITVLNNKIQEDGSGASISNLNVTYNTHLKGRNLSTSIDYKIIIEGTISDYVISKDKTKILIDLGWRGMSTTQDVVINGVEINKPISAIKTQEPEVYKILEGTKAEEILSNNLFDIESIKSKPMTKWRFLYDPVGKYVKPESFGLDESITEFPVSHWITGISSSRGDPRQIAEIHDAEVDADQNYVIRTITDIDEATISTVGFGIINSLDGIEIAEITPNPPTPLKQIKYGIPPDEIRCKEDLVFVFKNYLSTACVKETSVIPLMIRGWAEVHNFEITQGFPEHEIVGAEITSMTFDSLGCGWFNFEIVTYEDGELSISIPLEIFDFRTAYEDDYSVLLNGKEVNFEEKKHPKERILTFLLPLGSELIRINPGCPH